MLALTLASLFVIVTLASALALTDSWLRGQSAFSALKQERALARAGFVPMVEAQDLRLRKTVRYSRCATRSFARRLPAHPPQKALDAA